METEQGFYCLVFGKSHFTHTHRGILIRKHHNHNMQVSLITKKKQQIQLIIIKRITHKNIIKFYIEEKQRERGVTIPETRFWIAKGLCCGNK